MTINIELSSPRSAPLRISFDNDTNLNDISTYMRTHHNYLMVGCCIRTVSVDDPDVIPLGEWERKMAINKSIKPNERWEKKKSRRPRTEGLVNMKLRR